MNCKYIFKESFGKALKWIFGILIMLFLLSTDCAERSRDNPFDPSGMGNSPVYLDLSYVNDHVLLKWTIDDISDYQGFRIYRAVDNPENFESYARVAPGKFTFEDSSIQNYRWYFYKITIIGKANESRPSNIQKTLPGPGFHWVLSGFGFWVKKVSYDLLHGLNQFNISLPPEEWTLSLTDSVVWLSFSRYSTISKLNLSKGIEEYFLENHLQKPVDVEYDPFSQKLYVLDDGVNYVYIIESNIISDTLSLPEDEYVKCQLVEELQQLYILGERNFLNISLKDHSSDTLFQFPAQLNGQDFEVNQGHIFLLASSPTEANSLILIKETASAAWDTLNFNGKFIKIAIDLTNAVMYIVELKSTYKHRVMKLSLEGERLQELSDFIRVEQVVVNPHDQSIVIVDRFDDHLFLFDKSGNLMSKSTELFDSIRAYIE